VVYQQITEDPVYRLNMFINSNALKHILLTQSGSRNTTNVFQNTHTRYGFFTALAIARRLQRRRRYLFGSKQQ